MSELTAASVSLAEVRDLRCGEKVLDLSRPQVMGVLNITPDSFFDGGRLYHSGRPDFPAVVDRAAEMALSGAAIFDVGAESTRPGADPVSTEQQLERAVPVVERLAARFETVISVDTSAPEVMSAAVTAGADLINDVRALRREGALQAAAECQRPVILMHMLAEPATMQLSPHYQDVVAEVADFLRSRRDQAMGAGIVDVLLDPGFGFGKTLTHNLQLLTELDAFHVLGCPLVVGLSRKSMFGALLGREQDERLAASLAGALFAVRKGARILRVHDVAETADALRVWGAVEEAAERQGQSHCGESEPAAEGFT